jgi:DNA modification methylase
MREQVICADALEGLLQLDSDIADMCVCSPPYFNLRDYGVQEQIGLEATPEEFIERLVKVFREVHRVLRDDGTLWVVIGDSYAWSNKGGMTHPESTEGYLQATNYCGLPYDAIKKVSYPGCKPKDLIGIPWMLAFALRADGWYLRQDIIFNKLNPMPEPVTNRCSKTHEYMFLLSKNPHYYFDHEAIKEPVSENTKIRAITGTEMPKFGGQKYGENPDVFSRTKSGKVYSYSPLRNKRSVWSVATNGYKGAHFATYPKELIRPCILAGSKAGGNVLDPFFGSGTTGVVAMEEQRGFIGIEINPEYVEISKRRLQETQVQYKLAL